jgi:hypothetical protein
MNDQDLTAIKDRLQTGYCNPQWRKHVEQLISEVERLQSLLDAITRLSALDPAEFDHDPGSDTVIL